MGVVRKPRGPDEGMSRTEEGSGSYRPSTSGVKESRGSRTWRVGVGGGGDYQNHNSSSNSNSSSIGTETTTTTRGKLRVWPPSAL